MEELAPSIKKVDRGLGAGTDGCRFLDICDLRPR